METLIADLMPVIIAIGIMIYSIAIIIRGPAKGIALGNKLVIKTITGTIAWCLTKVGQLFIWVAKQIR